MLAEHMTGEIWETQNPESANPAAGNRMGFLKERGQEHQSGSNYTHSVVKDTNHLRIIPTLSGIHKYWGMVAGRTMGRVIGQKEQVVQRQ